LSRLCPDHWSEVPQKIYLRDAAAFHCDMLTGPMYERTLDFVEPKDRVKLLADYSHGRVLDPNDVPTEAHPAGPDLRYSQPRDIFRLASGLLVVSSKMRDMLESFDLAASCFFPLRIRWRPHQTKWQKDFHVFQIRSSKDTLVPEKTFVDSYRRKKAGKRPQSGLKRVSLTKFELVGRWDTLVALESDATIGADIWMEERVKDEVFVSRALRDAICGANLRLCSFSPAWVTS